LKKKIQSILAKLPKQPTNEDLNDLLLATFALDKIGCLYKVTDTSRLPNDHPIWIKTQTLVPDYYYSDEFIQEKLLDCV